MDKKFKFLSKRVEKVLNILSTISLVGTVGSTVGVFLAKKPDKLSMILVGVFAFFGSSWIILDNIVNKSKQNRSNYVQELNKLKKEIVDKLAKIAKNTKLPQNVRDKAQETINKIDKPNVQHNRTIDLENLGITVINDFPKTLKLSKGCIEFFNNGNEQIIKNAIICLMKNHKNILKKIRETMIKDNDEYVNAAKDNNREWSFDELFYDDYYYDGEGDIVLDGQLSTSDNYIPIYIFYDIKKKAISDYGYGAIG